MRVHKMTKYDEGQVLIKASDTLFECATELHDTQPELCDMLHHMGCQIGSKFNELKYPQGFGLRGLDECGCNNCRKCDHHETIGKAEGPERCARCGKVDPFAERTVGAKE